MSYKSQTAKTALGGMMVALSVIVMLPTIFESFSMVLPLVASVMILFCVIELNKSWALAVYAVTSLITLLILPNKEGAVMYLVFFGYYPIIKALLERKRLPRLIEYIIKFLIYNCAMIASFFISTKVLGVPYDQFMGIENPNSFFARHAAVILLLVANIVLIPMDYFLTSCATLYVRRLQKQFHKMFRFK